MHADFDDGPPEPAPKHRWTMLLGRTTAAAAVIALLSLFARETSVTPPRLQALPDSALAPSFVPAAANAVRQAVPVSLSAPRYRLDEADGAEPARVEAARLNPATGRREDALAQGAFPVIEAPYLRITVTDGAPSAAAGLFVTMVRRAADGPGLSIVRTGERGRIDTKFGPMETLEATLSGEGSRVCTGFATLPSPGTDSAAIALDGWLCAPLGQPPEPRAIACALDRLLWNGQASQSFQASQSGQASQNAQASRKIDPLDPVFETRRDAGCGRTARAEPSREATTQTGSIARRDTRARKKNEAKLRQISQARP